MFLQVAFFRIQRTLLENVFNCLQLTTFANYILVYWFIIPHLEMLSKNTMTCLKLKQLTEVMARRCTREGFQWITAFSSIQLSFGDRVILAGSPVFHITIVIHCAKQYANFISALAELCETYRDHSLAASIKSFLASIYRLVLCDRWFMSPVKYR